jgi:HlyD family secretion protein
MKFLLFLALGLTIVGCSGRDPDTITASGTIEGTDVTIAAEVAGKVMTRRVDEGSRVNRGDTLLTIDDTDYKIQLRQALANAQASEAQFTMTKVGPRKEDIAQAEIAYRHAEENFRRMEGLIDSHAVTQSQYDDARAQYIATQQAYEKQIHGSRPEEIETARARRDQAEAQVDQLRKKVHDCTILSPTTGVVTLKSVEPGEYVTVGASLLRITYLDTVKLTIYVGETQLGNVRLGQKAKIAIDTYKDRTFDGDVSYISQVAEFTPKNVQTTEERSKLVFAVKIELHNPDGILKPGMPADATLLLH